MKILSQTVGGILLLISFSIVHSFPHSGVAQLSAGGYHTCVLLADHRVACWGGSGLVAQSLAPTLIPVIDSAVVITSGSDFACALTIGQQIYCWGENAHGQLGDNSRISRSTPEHILWGNSFAAISAGNDHICAIEITASNRGIFCFGSNSDGQLGNYRDSVGSDELSGDWVYVHDGITNPLLQNVDAISSGAYHTCATLTNGSSACWGYNADGELGDGTTHSINSPSTVTVPDGMGVPVPLGMIAGRLAGGAFNTCGLVPDGGPSGMNVNSAACWGNNRYGSVGSPVGSFTTIPAAVMQFSGEKLYDVETIASGGNFTCALMKDTSLMCWGLNSYGQLGNDMYTVSSPNPVFVTSPSGRFGFSKLAVGASHVCAIQNGDVVCWGQNLLGQLGQGTVDNSKHYLPQIVNLDAPIFTDNFDGN